MCTLRPLAGLAVLLLAGCSLDLPGPAPQPAPAKGPYDVWNQDRTEMRRFDGNDQLLWIDRYVPEPAQGNEWVEKSRYSAADVLQFFEKRRSEPYLEAGGKTVWRPTRMKHYLPPKSSPTLVSGEAWSWDAAGNPVVDATYGPDNKLTGYRVDWYQPAVLSDGQTVQRRLQTAVYTASGTATGYERFHFGDPGRNSPANWTQATGRLWTDGTPAFGGLFSQTWDPESHLPVTETTYNKAWTPNAWSRTTHSYLSSATRGLTNWEYLQTWASAPGTAPTPAPSAAVGPPVTADPSQGFNETANPTDSLNGLVLPDISGAQLIAWADRSASFPASWTSSGGKYRLPGPNGGTVTIEFDGQGRPTILHWLETALSEIRVDLSYDVLGQLAKRTVSYGGAPVLTVGLTRDPQGRVSRVDVGGTMMKLPLTYLLAYPGGSDRPSSIEVQTGTVGLLTLDFVYDTTKTAAALPYGLGALNFDDTVKTLTLGVGTGTAKLSVIELAFQGTTGGTQTALLSDVLGKGGPDQSPKVLKGRLSWGVDGNQHQANLVWQTTADGGTSYKDAWSYKAAWGTQVSFAADAAVAGQETLAAAKTRLADVFATVESFDIEKVFQLVNAVQPQTGLSQGQFERSASNLVDQVKAALGK